MIKEIKTMIWVQNLINLGKLSAILGLEKLTHF